MFAFLMGLGGAKSPAVTGPAIAPPAAEVIAPTVGMEVESGVPHHAYRQLPFAHEGRGALLQPEQIEGLSRLCDEYPGAATARVQLRARFDADDIYVHARDRVIRERRVRQRDTDERPAAGYAGEVVLVAATHDDQSHRCQDALNEAD